MKETMPCFHRRAGALCISDHFWHSDTRDRVVSNREASGRPAEDNRLWQRKEMIRQATKCCGIFVRGTMPKV